MTAYHFGSTGAGACVLRSIKLISFEHLDRNRVVHGFWMTGIEWNAHEDILSGKCHVSKMVLLKSYTAHFR